MSRLFAILVAIAIAASSCGTSTSASVVAAPTTDAEPAATTAPATPPPATTAPASPVPATPAPLAAAPTAEAQVVSSAGAGPQGGADGVWCQTWRELDTIETNIDSADLTDAQSNERLFAESLPILQGVVAHAPADLDADVNAYVQASLFLSTEAQAAGWELAQFSDEAIGVLTNTIGPLDAAIEDYNMQFCGIGDFTRPDARTEAPTVEAPSTSLEMPTTVDEILTAAEASAVLSGAERNGLLAPLIETGLTEVQSECVMFAVLTTTVLEQGDEAFDQLLIRCGA